MYDLLALYAKPLRIDEPVVCIDEKSPQSLSHIRPALPMASHSPAKSTTGPSAGARPTCSWRSSLRRAREPSRSPNAAARPTSSPSSTRFSAAPTPRRAASLVLDNLNIHFSKSFEDVLGNRGRRQVCFHHTPKHASWLNMEKSRSASSRASAWIAACLIRACSSARSTLGNLPATRTGARSNGSSRDKMPMRS